MVLINNLHIFVPAEIQRLPCVGHLVHNAVTKALDDEKIEAVMAKCRRIVGLMHSSHVFKSKLKKAQKDMKLTDKQLVNDVSTRWGSKYKMLSRIKAVMPALNSIFLEESRKYGHLAIEAKEMEVIDSVLHALEGFHILTDILSGEKEVTISSTIPLMRFIHGLCQTDEDDDELSTMIKESIMNYLNLKLSTTMPNCDIKLLPFLRICEFLDPRYLHQFLAEDDPAQIWLAWGDADEVREDLVKSSEKILSAREGNSSSNASISSAGTVSDTENSPVKKKTKPSLVGLLLSQKPTQSQPDVQQPPVADPKADLRREIDFYTRMKVAGNDTDVLKWWGAHEKELPLLAQCTRYYFSACSTSVPSERLFSISGHIVSKRRNALKPTIFDQLVFLAINN